MSNLTSRTETAEPNPFVTAIEKFMDEAEAAGLGEQVLNALCDQTALLSKLRARGNVAGVIGGYEMRETINTQENSSAGSYSGYDYQPSGAQDGFTCAKFNWSQYAVPFVVSGREVKNEDSSIFDSRLKLTKHTMVNLLTRHLYLGGDGNNGKNLSGLAAMVPLNPLSAMNPNAGDDIGKFYGGIDASRPEDAIWRNQSMLEKVNVENILDHFEAMFKRCTRGDAKPDLIICGPAIFELYTKAVSAKRDRDDEEPGFVNYLFNGAPVMFESTAAGIDTNTAYFLNTEFIHFRYHRDRKFVFLKNIDSTASDSYVKCLAFMGNLTCSGRKFQGVFVGIPSNS